MDTVCSGGVLCGLASFWCLPRVAWNCAITASRCLWPKRLAARCSQEYNAALEREDYGEAARLRDAGGLGLAGWWHARSDADPCAHLLRIAPDFGRLSGLMYTSRDLAELKARRSPVTCQATCIRTKAHLLSTCVCVGGRSTRLPGEEHRTLCARLVRVRSLVLLVSGCAASPLCSGSKAQSAGWPYASVTRQAILMCSC